MHLTSSTKLCHPQTELIHINYAQSSTDEKKNGKINDEKTMTMVTSQGFMKSYILLDRI